MFLAFFRKVWSLVQPTKLPGQVVEMGRIGAARPRTEWWGAASGTGNCPSAGREQHIFPAIGRESWRFQADWSGLS